MSESGYEVLSNQGVTNETLEAQARGEKLDAIVSGLSVRGAQRVLDVGCGSGALTRSIARAAGAGTTVYGIDVSAAHLEYARRATEEAGLGNVVFVEADFLADGDPPWPRDFDLVVEKYVLMYQVGKEGTFIDRMRACTRPGGRIGLIEADINFGGERFPPAPEPLASVLPRVVEYYRRRRLIEWRSGLRLFHHLIHAGFTQLEVRLIDGRIIAGGSPSALVEHANVGVDDLIAPCLEEAGMSGERERVVRQWQEYLHDPGSFLYTPIFLGEGRV